MSPPNVCYQYKAGEDPVFRARYSHIAESVSKSSKVAAFNVPPRSGKAWEVRAGQICRVLVVEGSQVGDLNFWNLHNPRERFYSSKTRQLHRSHLTVSDRLWSCFPYLRPLATITADTLAYGIDEDGAGVHDVIGSRCDPYTNMLMTGEVSNNCCHSNLTRAVTPWNLGEADVHDVFNIFMCTGFNKKGQYFAKASPGRKGDYIEFVAEIDLLVALSTCPQGDVSVPCGQLVPASLCHSLGVEVYQPPEGTLESAGWTPAEPVRYNGSHGLAEVV